MSAAFSHFLVLVAARDAATLDAATIARARDAAQGGPPGVLAPGEAAEIPCGPAPDMNRVRAALDDGREGGQPIDAVLLPASGRRKRLLVADMDSTMVIGETLDELADQAGLRDEIAAITRASMNGEIDFATALRRRVAMLKGLDLAALEATWRAVRPMPGGRALVATMRAHGAVTALVSGGFTYFTERVARRLGFDVQRANTLLDDGRALTGAVAEPILGRDAKRAVLAELAAAHGLDREATLAVGDGANDLAMLEAAGLGVAYHAKPIVAAVSRARIEHADLRALLFIQGYPETAFAPA